MRVRLTRTLADELDGIDLTRHRTGDVVDLPDRDAQLLLAEGWASVDRRVAASSRVVAFRRSDDLGLWYHEHESRSKVR
jgi:hypothetical protein